MNIILLSGGSGKRLWPLSNDVRSKQFLKLFKHEDSYESMVQRVYRQITSTIPNAQVTIATGKNQVASIQHQLNDKVSICVEPARRDTFPAILLACSFLHDVKNVDINEPVVICPVDPYVNEDYFVTLTKLASVIEEDQANIALMGIEPTYPSEKYGYLIPKTKDSISDVDVFKEKPSEKVAQQYIEQGGLWNGGVFALKLSYILEKSKSIYDFSDYYDLLNHYSMLEKISFDYAVVEKESSIKVVRFNGQWKDLGTWNTLTEEMDSPYLGKILHDDNCLNLSVINELDVPILCMGLKDTIVAASAEGILVSDKHDSSYIKPYVDGIEQQVMFAEKSWGSYTVLDVQDSALTIRITLNQGHRMNYHSHQYRDEVWTVVKGNGRTIVDGIEEPVHPGDVITLGVGCKHTIIADTDMILIEVQLGNNISVEDKIKYELHH